MPILERLEELYPEMVELRPHFCLCIRLLRQQHIIIHRNNLSPIPLKESAGTFLIRACSP